LSGRPLSAASAGVADIMASTRHVFTIDRDIGIPGSSFAMGFVIDA
jgi:hypothetical protein